MNPRYKAVVTFWRVQFYAGIRPVTQAPLSSNQTLQFLSCDLHLSVWPGSLARFSLLGNLNKPWLPSKHASRAPTKWRL